jgi:hypothetical protein
MFDILLEGENLDRFSSGFFSFGTKDSKDESQPDWTNWRDRWEYSHIARAGLAPS